MNCVNTTLHSALVGRGFSTSNGRNYFRAIESLIHEVSIEKSKGGIAIGIGLWLSTEEPLQIPMFPFSTITPEGIFTISPDPDDCYRRWDPKDKSGLQHSIGEYVVPLLDALSTGDFLLRVCQQIINQGFVNCRPFDISIKSKLGATPNRKLGLYVANVLCGKTEAAAELVKGDTSVFWGGSSVAEGLAERGLPTQADSDRVLQNILKFQGEVDLLASDNLFLIVACGIDKLGIAEVRKRLCKLMPKATDGELRDGLDGGVAAAMWGDKLAMVAQGLDESLWGFFGSVKEASHKAICVATSSVNAGLVFAFAEARAMTRNFVQMEGRVEENVGKPVEGEPEGIFSDTDDPEHKRSASLLSGLIEAHFGVRLTTLAKRAAKVAEEY